MTVAPPPPADHSVAPEEPPRDRLRRLDVLLLVAIVAVLGGVRFARLAEPSRIIPLDERHYVPDARDVLRFGTESDVRARSGAFVVHPPVGKLLIAAGIKGFGNEPFGWRFFGALAGTSSLAVMYLLARRLWGSPWWAALAATLLGLDGLWFVQSRVAMLDGFAAVFTLAGAWLLLDDRARPSRVVRLGGAAALGLALATKWSVLPIVAALTGAWIVWARRRGARAIAAGVLTLTLVPAVVYVGSYVGWFADPQRYDPPRCDDTTGLIARWWCYQGEMAGFHRGLDKLEPADDDEEGTAAPATAPGATTGATTGETTGAPLEPGHPYFSHAWSWPWIGRPVVHHYVEEGEGGDELASEVLGLPNPAIWWPAFALALPALAWWTIRRDVTAGFLLGMIAAGWLPFLAADLPAWAPDAIDLDRPVFLFYATPMVPFLVLAVVHLLSRTVGRWPEASLLVAGYVVVCAGVFAYFYPVLAGAAIPKDGAFGWSAHMWFTADCGATERIRILCWI